MILILLSFFYFVITFQNNLKLFAIFWLFKSYVNNFNKKLQYETVCYRSTHNTNIYRIPNQ